MHDDLFEKIIRREIPGEIVYENDATAVFLNIQPMSRGHVLVVPKHYARDLQSGSEQDAIELMKTIYHIAPRIMKALGATGYNLGMNHGAIAGQEVFHTHIHLMPRYEGEARTFEKQSIAPEEMKEVADLIRAEM